MIDMTDMIETTDTAGITDKKGGDQGAEKTTGEIIGILVTTVTIVINSRSGIIIIENLKLKQQKKNLKIS